MSRWGEVVRGSIIVGGCKYVFEGCFHIPSDSPFCTKTERDPDKFVVIDLSPLNPEVIPSIEEKMLSGNYNRLQKGEQHGNKS